MVQPVTTQAFTQQCQRIFRFFGTGAVHIIKPLTVSIHIIVWLKRLKAAVAESAALRLSANLFRFSSVTRLFRFQFGDFRFQRLFNHGDGRIFSSLRAQITI